MDTGLIIGLVISGIVIAAIAALLTFLITRYKPESRGKRGENAVIYAIESTKQGKYYLINDIIIEDKNGMTHQIDHIVINRNGLFVIETKNYSGDIYGTENQNEWLQVLGNGNTRNRLRNPVKQNKSHLYCLGKILPHMHFRPLVVFVQNNTRHIQADTVIPLRELPQTLTASDGSILSEEQMLTCYHKILAAKADITNEEHVKRIRRQQDALAKGICPRCGAKLVVRNRRDGTGSFYGCSNFPKCKFTKNID